MLQGLESNLLKNNFQESFALKNPRYDFIVTLHINDDDVFFMVINPLIDSNFKGLTKRDRYT